MGSVLSVVQASYGVSGHLRFPQDSAERPDGLAQTAVGRGVDNEVCPRRFSGNPVIVEIPLPRQNCHGSLKLTGTTGLRRYRVQQQVACYHGRQLPGASVHRQGLQGHSMNDQFHGSQENRRDCQRQHEKTRRRIRHPARTRRVK